jgi:polysaccharide pyruvyl transferase WcaK-like protein
MRLFVVSMLGAGNLGDDLISAYLVRYLAQIWPAAQIGLLTHEQPNGFSYPNKLDITLFRAPRRRGWDAYIKHGQDIKAFLKNTDLIIIGGGGLFQDTYTPFTAHKWLRFTYMAPDQTAAAALGVGFGPLEGRYPRWYLKNMLKRLSTIQVRDIGSQKLVSELGYDSLVAPDVVLGSDIALSAFGEVPARSDAVLGCSIRPWPGQQNEQILALIEAVCRTNRLMCAFFVFEHVEPYNTEEYDYAARLAARLETMGIETEIYCYNRDETDTFVRAFVSVSCAIASRYHANILWQKLGKPVIPLAYAPKVERLYSERGAASVHVKRIDAAQASTMFQRIKCDESYRIPNELLAPGAVPDLGKVNVIAKISGMAETTYGLGKSVQWRVKRRLK